MKIVKIDIEDNIYNIDIDINSNTNDQEILDIIRKKDENKNIENLYNWKYDNNIMKLYGCMINDYNIKNKHKLPLYGISNIIDEKSEDVFLYSNIYLICKSNNIPIDFFDSDYGSLYFNLNEFNLNEFSINEFSINESDNLIDDYESENNYQDTYKKSILQDEYNFSNNLNINELLDYDNNIYLKI